MSMELSEFRAIAKEYNVIPVWRKVFADNEVINGIKYYVKATEDKFSVETEGNWKIENPLGKPFLEIMIYLLNRDNAF